MTHPRKGRDHLPPLSHATTGPVTGRRRRVRPRTVILIALAVVLVAGGIIGVRTWQTITTLLPGGGISTPINGRYTIALLGADSATWRDGARIDSATVASVDAVTGRTLVISVPRNLVNLPFPSTSPLHALYPDGYTCPNQAVAPCMLTMVYQTGLDHADLYDTADPGARATVDALEGITGLTINYYAFLDMDGFTALIDAMGGLDITIRTRVPVGALDQVMYWIDPGTHHFTGEETLWYVRSRVGTDDYTRMTRQKCVMLTMLTSLGPETIATHFRALAQAAGETARTNVGPGDVGTLLPLARAATTWTITGLNLTPPLIDPLNPNYRDIHRLVNAAITHVEALDTAGAAAADGTLTDLTTSCGY